MYAKYLLALILFGSVIPVIGTENKPEAKKVLLGRIKSVTQKNDRGESWVEGTINDEKIDKEFLYCVINKNWINEDEEIRECIGGYKWNYFSYERNINYFNNQDDIKDACKVLQELNKIAARHSNFALYYLELYDDGSFKGELIYKDRDNKKHVLPLPEYFETPAKKLLEKAFLDKIKKSENPK